MRLFLDASSRVFRGQAPEGAAFLGDVLTVGTVELDVTDSDWAAIYYPAWSASAASGQDLVIDIFGGTSLVTHTATARETAILTLTNYQKLVTPTQAQDSAAIKALIVLFEIAKLLSTLPVPVVSLQRVPIQQGRRRPTRPRSRPQLVSIPVASGPSLRGQLNRSLSRRPPRRSSSRRSR